MRQTKQATLRALATRFNFELAEATTPQKRRALAIGQPAPRWILHPTGPRWAGETVYSSTLDHALSVLTLFNACAVHTKPKRIKFVIDEYQVVVNP